MSFTLASFHAPTSIRCEYVYGLFDSLRGGFCMIKPTRVWSVWAVQRPVKGCEGPVQYKYSVAHGNLIVFLWYSVPYRTVLSYCTIVQSTLLYGAVTVKLLHMTPISHQPSAIIVVPT